MAHVTVEATGVSVHLSLGDEILAMHGSLHIPLTHISAVSTDRVPEAFFRGFKIGTNVPGVKTAGSFITGDGMIFYDFHDPSRCLTLALTHEKYGQVVVEVDRDQDLTALAQDIRARLSAT
ncbi:MAG: hypothetical protein ACYCO4_03625 [Sulfobacillus sp.]